MKQHNFALNQTALEVCQTIVANQPIIQTVTLIAHNVEINWRQKFVQPEEKLAHLQESFLHIAPLEMLTMHRDTFCALNLSDLPKLKPHQVWSISSKVHCIDSLYRHVPMMNFHPEHGTLADIKKAISYICKNKEGVILKSGRYVHYYGNFLLKTDQWLSFMGNFLMPSILVSPRYIGHGLNYGYVTLRLSNDSLYKPMIPHVIDTIHTEEQPYLQQAYEPTTVEKSNFSS